MSSRLQRKQYFKFLTRFLYILRNFIPWVAQHPRFLIMNWYRLFYEVVSVLPVFPIYYFGKKYYTNLEKELKIYWFFLLFSFVIQLGMIISARNHIHNVFVNILFQTIEYTLLSVLFYSWNSNKIIRGLIVFFVIFNIFSWIYHFTGHNIDYSKTTDKYLRNFVLIPLSFYTAYQFAVESKSDLLTDIKFWFLGGILVNVTLISFTQIIQAYTLRNADLNFLVGLFILIINTLSCIMFIKGFLCLKIKMKYTGSYH